LLAVILSANKQTIPCLLMIDVTINLF